MSLFVGDVAPEIVQMSITSGASGLDLTTVSSVTIKVQKPNGSTLSWATTLSNQTSTTLTATYTLAAGTSDIDVSGMWRFYAVLTVPGGFMRTESSQVQVYQAYGP